MTRVHSSTISNHVEQEVTLYGWVHAIRAHSKVLFIDMKDIHGLTQVVAGPWLSTAFEALKTVGTQDVLSITGLVKLRPENLVNPDLSSGKIELEAHSVEILSRSSLPPFELTQTTLPVDEELRLSHRYLDLRSSRMQKNIINRHRVVQAIRQFLVDRDFLEIETPILTASTPEGARDFVVPTRHHGEYYALPQSPQQYKQLLMVAGFERYFQIARCMRDEDSRGDRQPEFTQLDMELSFTSQEEILLLTEEMYTTIINKLYPEKQISKSPWPRLSYAQALSEYGTDKPDLRTDKENPNELAFAWILDFPLFEQTDTGGLTPTHHMFTMPRAQDIPNLESDPLSVIGQLFDMVCNGYEIASGSIRVNDPSLQAKIFSLIGISDEEAQHRFGHLLTAFQFGTPPHGGIAPGIDRMQMILENEPSIREVIAFPKTGEGRDPLMGSPTTLTSEQLKELGIRHA
jgi:aspartyl-tRNA synthetase